MSPTAAAFVQMDLGEATRTVVVQVRIKMSGVETLDLVGVFAADVAIVEVLANDGPIFAFDQRVVRAAVGTGTGEFRQQFVEQLSHLVVDELGAIAGSMFF